MDPMWGEMVGFVQTPQGWTKRRVMIAAVHLKPGKPFQLSSKG